MERIELKRLTINELAEIMPKVEENEQKTCVGRDKFYGFDGVELGNIGSGSNIFIMRSAVEITYQGGEKITMYTNPTPFSSSLLNERQAVATTMASSMGINLNIFEFFNETADILGRYSQLGKIGLNIQSGYYFNTSNVNWNTMMSVLYHEQYHHNNPYGNPDQREYDAYKAESLCSYFTNADQGYKNDVLAYMVDLAKLAWVIP